MAQVKQKNTNADFEPDTAFLGQLVDGGGWVPANDQGARWHANEGYVTTDGMPDSDGDILYELTDLGKKWLAADQIAEQVAETLPAPPVGQAIAPAPIQHALIAAPAPRKRRTIVVPSSLDHISAEIDNDAPPPVRSPRGFALAHRERGESPVRKALALDALEIGQSRHIAATAEIPEPWKHYASSVSLENRRHATQRKNADGSPLVRIRNIKGKDGTVHPKPFGVFDYAKKYLIYKAADNDPRGPGARVKRVDPVTGA